MAQPRKTTLFTYEDIAERKALTLHSQVCACKSKLLDVYCVEKNQYNGWTETEHEMLVVLRRKQR